MKITVLFSIVVDGKHAEAGSTVETSEVTGNLLISDRVAVLATEKQKDEEPQPPAEKAKKTAK
jgi:hypothetical protein